MIMQVKACDVCRSETKNMDLPMVELTITPQHPIQPNSSLESIRIHVCMECTWQFTLADVLNSHPAIRVKE